MKIRVLASPFQTEQVARLGGTGVPMTTAEVLPALQQGTIDGAPVPPSLATCSVWNGEARTRIFLPLKSARVRAGARIANTAGPLTNRPTPRRPLLAPIARNALANSGSVIALIT